MSQSNNVGMSHVTTRYAHGVLSTAGEQVKREMWTQRVQVSAVPRTCRAVFSHSSVFGPAGPVSGCALVGSSGPEHQHHNFLDFSSVYNKKPVSAQSNSPITFEMVQPPATSSCILDDVLDRNNNTIPCAHPSSRETGTAADSL